jgi:hypothetical protein
MGFFLNVSTWLNNSYFKKMSITLFQIFENEKNDCNISNSIYVV